MFVLKKQSMLFLFLHLLKLGVPAQREGHDVLLLSAFILHMDVYMYVQNDIILISGHALHYYLW